MVSVSSSPLGNDLTLTFVTNEYTTALLEYGLTTGSYPNTQNSDLYRYTHIFTLPGIDSGQVYYYRLTLTDRSGNVTHTAEATLEPMLSIYLPALIHR